MNKNIKRGLQVLLPLVLGGTILYWLYRDFDFSRVREVFWYGMNWWWMLISLIFGVFSHLFRGWRWRQTLEPLGACPRRSLCVNVIFISYAANLVLPRVGEISRCGILARYDGISFSRSLGTVVTERMLDVCCIGAITLFTFLLQTPVFGRFFRTTGTRLADLTGLLTSAHVYIILFCVLALGILIWYLVRTLSFFEKVRGFMFHIWEGISSLRKVRNKWKFALYTFLIWFCYFMQFFVSFYCFSFTQHLGIAAGLVLFVGGTLAVVVPTPNGAGPWHFAIATLLVLYGIDATDAGIFALIVHGIQTFLIALLGIYALAALPFTNKKLSL